MRPVPDQIAASYTRHPAPYTRHPAPYTLLPTPCTPHPAPCTLHHTPELTRHPQVLIRSYSRCEIKIIDFGSSCYVTDHLTSYVQSRSYRAPEVILGLPYDQQIDM